MGILSHVETDNPFERTARDDEIVAHEQTNLRRRELDNRTSVAKARKVKAVASSPLVGLFRPQLAQFVPRFAHIAQIGGEMQVGEIRAHAAVHKQRATLQVEVKNANRNHIDSLDRRECSDVLLPMARIQKKRRNGAEEEKRPFDDEGTNPHWAQQLHDGRNRRRDKRQLGNHARTTVVRSKPDTKGDKQQVKPQDARQSMRDGKRRCQQTIARRA